MVALWHNGWIPQYFLQHFPTPHGPQIPWAHMINLPAMCQVQGLKSERPVTAHAGVSMAAFHGPETCQNIQRWIDKSPVSMGNWILQGCFLPFHFKFIGLGGKCLGETISGRCWAWNPRVSMLYRSLLIWRVTKRSVEYGGVPFRLIHVAGPCFAM